MEPDKKPSKVERAAEKVSRIPVKIAPEASKQTHIPKPEWIRVKLPSGKRYQEIRQLLSQQNLHTVCQEASCPNIGECFERGTATFLIMGDICTRRCPFCDVAHGKPEPLDPTEPLHLAEAAAIMRLKYVVITSVDRDDLKDGGAAHFAACIQAIRHHAPDTRIEILVPDFRGRLPIALTILSEMQPDVLNHNLETVPRLYKACRPGADYNHSLKLLADYKQVNPTILTKSGIMVGLGETDEEVRQTMRDLRNHQVDILTIGQYLRPTKNHLPVSRYVTPAQFAQLEETAFEMGFKQATVGALVRSSYHADQQVREVSIHDHPDTE